MKKMIIVVLCLLFSELIFADAPYFGAGLGVRFSPYSWTEYVPLTDAFGGNYTNIINYSEGIVGVGGYLDMYYARISVFVGFGNRLDYLYNVNDIFVELEVLAKLPIRIGEGYFLWPAIGIEKTVIIAETSMWGSQINLGFEYREIMSPLFVKAGAGLDMIFGVWVITPEILFSYNLTPKPSFTMFPSPELITYFSFKIDAGVSIGTKF